MGEGGRMVESFAASRGRMNSAGNSLGRDIRNILRSPRLPDSYGNKGGLKF